MKYSKGIDKGCKSNFKDQHLSIFKFSTNLFNLRLNSIKMKYYLSYVEPQWWSKNRHNSWIKKSGIHFSIWNQLQAIPNFLKNLQIRWLSQTLHNPLDMWKNHIHSNSKFHSRASQKKPIKKTQRKIDWGKKASIDFLRFQLKNCNMSFF